MSEARPRLIERLRRLFTPNADGAARFPGREAHLSGRRALLELESRMCERVCRSSDVGQPPEIDERNSFGRQIVVTASESASGCIAGANGSATCGLRTAAFLAADALPRIAVHLRAAVVRRTPYILHAEAGDAGHGGFHAVAGTGAFTLFASHAQQLLDLTVAARLIAELTLVPGVVAIDGPECLEAEIDLLLPDDELIREVVGAPDGEIDSPTSSQGMLFGERRRRLPRWFDSERPTALGMIPDGAELEAAVAGRRAFFADHVEDIAAQALEVVGRLTGRPLGRLTRFHVPGARHLVVTQGAAVGVAETVAADVAKRRTGVIGVVWSLPFPKAELEEALAGAESVTVLERADESVVDSPPLLRHVRRALRGASPRLQSATYNRLSAGALESLLRDQVKGESVRPSVHLGLGSPQAASDYPKRQILLDRIARDYPQLAGRALPAKDAAAGKGMSGQAPPEPPWIVRRLERPGTTYDSVPRFWGEFVEPRLRGKEDAAPDPFLALGAVPSWTATFHDRTGERERAPVIDAAKCTACGACWTGCPDASIAPAVVSTEALLEAAFEAASGEAASAPATTKLRRAFKQLAARIDGRLAKSGGRQLETESLDAAYAWLVEKMDVTDDEREQMDPVFERMRAVVDKLDPSVTPALFHELHAEKKGSGNLLALAVDTRTCQGCGICAEVCSERAIEIAPQSDDRVAAMREHWRAWEGLPDTPGATIARAGRNPEVGDLPSILMSRHCNFAIAGADGAERGSGERLGVRQIAAVVEYEMQRRTIRYSQEAERLGGELREAIGKFVSGALPTDNLDFLESALEEPASGGLGAAGLIARLEELGGRSNLDAARLRDLAATARRVEQAQWRATTGPHGLGRSRYGVVVAGGSVADWAARFPRNPFSVPVVVDAAGEGPELAIGIVEGMLAERVEEIRELRRARLLLEAPADLPARLRELGALTWRDLEPDELAGCPPLLLFAGPEALSAGELSGWSRLFSCDLPVKMVLLDGRELPVHGAEPALLALAHRRAFVLSTSIAHPQHLFDGVVAALESSGPALIHLYAPSPGRHGFPSEQTVDRARLAVASRVHPLLRYDPAAEGVFGRRMGLDGNPAIRETWAPDADGKPQTPAEWAAGEGRYSGAGESAMAAVVRDRADYWTTLQEIAGIVSPFTEQVREQAERELEADHAAETEALRREYESKLEALQNSQDAEQVARLRARLMQLAGLGALPKGGGRQGGAGS